MKIQKQIIFATLILTFGLSFSSCKKDKENPTITVESPTEHSEHKWGDQVHVEATFSDDRGLKKYSVIMGDTDGNHLHSFDFEKTGEISGKMYDFHEHFVVPNSAEMMAWLHFSVTDEEDKTTTKKWMLHFAE